MKLLERDNITELPRAAYGLAQGFVRYFIVAPIVDKIESLIPSQEELDALITEVGAEYE